jgi:hypothetical protein
VPGRLLIFIALFLALGFAPVAAQSTSDAQVTSIESKLESLRLRLKSVQAIVDEGQYNDEVMANQKAAIEQRRANCVGRSMKCRRS